MRAFLDHTKCSADSIERVTCSPGTGPDRFFELGNLRLYGQTDEAARSATVGGAVPDIAVQISRSRDSVRLPFDPTKIIDNLRTEVYADAVNREANNLADNGSLSRRIYYA